MLDPLRVLYYVLLNYGFGLEFDRTIEMKLHRLSITINKQKEPFGFSHTWDMAIINQFTTNEELEDYFSLHIGLRQKEYLTMLQKTDPVIINQENES